MREDEGFENSLQTVQKGRSFSPVQTPARQDAPFRWAAAARSARRRLLRSLTFADGREMVNARYVRGEGELTCFCRWYSSFHFSS